MSAIPTCRLPDSCQTEVASFPDDLAAVRTAYRFFGQPRCSCTAQFMYGFGHSVRTIEGNGENVKDANVVRQLYGPYARRHGRRIAVRRSRAVDSLCTITVVGANAARCPAPACEVLLLRPSIRSWLDPDSHIAKRGIPSSALSSGLSGLRRQADSFC